MSPYGLRQAPRPSKRLLEASEVSDERIRITMKRKARLEGGKKSETSDEATTISKAVQSDGAKMQMAMTIGEDFYKTMVYAPLKRKHETLLKDKEARVANRRTIKAKQPIALKHALDVEQSGSSKKTEKKTMTAIIPTVSNKVQNRVLSLSVIKPHIALDAHLKDESQPPEKQWHPRTKKAIKPVDLRDLRSLAASRGPQLTPDGNGIDPSPATLPSPETPYTPFSPDSWAFSTNKHVHIIQKKLDRGLVVPNYSPYDIVSGGKPPDLSEAEEKFWDERLGGVWQQEELPDRYGRLWRCVKMVGEEFEEDVGWDRGGTNGGAATGEDVSPGSTVEDFEREVELFLSAFGEELPEWSGLDEVDKLDFGED